MLSAVSVMILVSTLDGSHVVDILSRYLLQENRSYRNSFYSLSSSKPFKTLSSVSTSFMVGRLAGLGAQQRVKTDQIAPFNSAGFKRPSKDPCPRSTSWLMPREGTCALRLTGQSPVYNYVAEMSELIQNPVSEVHLRNIQCMQMNTHQWAWYGRHRAILREACMATVMGREDGAHVWAAWRWHRS